MLLFYMTVYGRDGKKRWFNRHLITTALAGLWVIMKVMIVNLEHRDTATKRSSDYEQEIFKLGSKNIGTLSGRSGDFVKT